MNEGNPTNVINATNPGSVPCLLEDMREFIQERNLANTVNARNLLSTKAS